MNSDKELLEFSLGLAKKAGDLLEKYQKKISKLTISTKEAQGVASEADLNSEKLIIKEITKAYPHMDILAEESSFEEFGGAKESYLHFKKKEWLWVIDPLDGTTNFLNGMDYYAVCICLMHKGKTKLGIVYRPVTGECFYALEGKGTKLVSLKDEKPRAKKIYTEKSSKKLKEALLVTGFATEKGEMLDIEFSMFKNMMGRSRGIRRMGSAALDMCYVASGIFDGFWERGLAPWDLAASSLICSEAGVKVTQYDHNSFNPFCDTVVCARAPLFKEFRTTLNAFR